MLRELHISNLAVITDVRIDLHPGLNCFTGATGAGKSLVIGAIELLLGLRSPAEMLRPGAEEARVSGDFEIRDPLLRQQLEKISDVTLDDGQLLITRKLYSTGRTSLAVNGNPITLGMLKQIAERLIDVHGQHDHQFLLKPANQLDVLDQFGHLDALREEYHEIYQKLAEARRTIDELSASRTLRDQRLELCRFQADEIDAAALDAREYAELEGRSAILKNLEKLKKDAGAAYAALYESEGSILDRLKGASGILAELATLDRGLSAISEAVRNATLALEDGVYDLSRYLNKLDLDPGELAEVADRLNTINRVLNKYGNTIEQTLEFREQLGRQIAELQHQTDDLSSLSSRLDPLRKQLAQLGAQLTTRRKAVAKLLAPQVEKSLAELGMDKAKFSIAITEATGAIPGEALAATPSGLDQIEFIVQTNPGQLALPLRKIASGGELSRVMLALKAILARSDRISVLVFDEIDANVGGRLGSVIGSKLRSLADHHQVLCITHLPQIACYADRQITVSKQVVDKATQSKVAVVEGQARVQELAEMIGGQHVTATTRAQAEELLKTAQADHAVKKPAMRPAKSGKTAK